MILCVDLDDTLASSGKTINECAIKFNKDILKRTTKIKKIGNCDDHYYFARMLEWNRDDLINFFKQCYPRYLNDIKIKYGTRNYLKLIKELNIKIYIVTSRKEINNDQVKKITINWLKKNKIYYDKLFVNVDDKAKLLKKIKPDFYIDDSLKNCSSVGKKLPSTKIYLMNTKYNKNVKANYTRINSIKDFYYIIKESDANERKYCDRQP